MTTSTIAGSAAAAALVLALAPSAWAKEGYDFVTFDHPDAVTTTNIVSINDHGDLAGNYDDADGFSRGFARIGGKLVDITFPGAPDQGALGITNDRVVTGTYFDASGFQHGYAWRKGHFQSIDLPGVPQNADISFEFGTGLGTAVLRSNDQGQVVGEYADPTGYSHGFLLTGGQVQSIDFPTASHAPGSGTCAFGINDRGHVVGSYLTDASPLYRGFLFDGSHYHAIDVPGASAPFGTEVNAINNNGVAVGPYSDAGGVYHGFIWERGKFTTIDAPGAIYTEIDGINSQRTLVGSWVGEDGLTFHGYIATRDD